MKTYFAMESLGKNSTNNDFRVFGSKEEMLNDEHRHLEYYSQFKTDANVWSYEAYSFDPSAINISALVNLLDEQAAEAMGIDTDALYSEIVGDEQTADKLDAYSEELAYQMKQWLRFEKLTPEVVSYIDLAQSDNCVWFFNLIETGSSDT